MRYIRKAALAVVMAVAAPAMATTYVEYKIAVNGTNYNNSASANPTLAGFTNSYTIYTQAGVDSWSNTTGNSQFAISIGGSGIALTYEISNATQTFATVNLGFDPVVFQGTEFPILTTSMIKSASFSTSATSGDYSTYTAPDLSDFTITTITQSTPFIYRTAHVAEALTPTAAPAAVPEPASWAMMVAGFGLMGAAMRRKKVSVRVA